MRGDTAGPLERRAWQPAVATTMRHVGGLRRRRRHPTPRGGSAFLPPGGNAPTEGWPVFRGDSQATGVAGRASRAIAVALDLLDRARRFPIHRRDRWNGLRRLDNGNLYAVGLADGSGVRRCRPTWIHGRACRARRPGLYRRQRGLVLLRRRPLGQGKMAVQDRVPNQRQRQLRRRLRNLRLPGFQSLLPADGDGRGGLEV